MAYPKVTVVGAGFVGATTAQRILEKEIATYNIDSLPTPVLKEAKKMGFSDIQISKIMSGNSTEDQVYEKRKALGITRVYKMVDTCAAEFEAKTPYFYSTFEG